MPLPPVGATLLLTLRLEVRVGDDVVPEERGVVDEGSLSADAAGGAHVTALQQKIAQFDQIDRLVVADVARPIAAADG